MPGKNRAADWLQVGCTTTRPEALEEALWAAGAAAITLTDAADHPVLEPPPGTTPLWPEIRLTALFDGSTAPQSIVRALRLALTQEQLPELSFSLLEDREWVREWLHYFKPRRFGRRLWILPGDAAAPEDADAACLRLDPGLAFGTGSHPTTELCLRWLDEAAGELPGRHVLDYGCGSGILALAALRLGAALASGTDIDPQALQASADNAHRNALTLALHPVSELPAGPYDVVIANILSGPLIELAPRLTALLKPGGSMVLSGLLETQADAVMDAYADRVHWQSPRHQDGWVCLVGERHDTDGTSASV